MSKWWLIAVVFVFTISVPSVRLALDFSIKLAPLDVILMMDESMSMRNQTVDIYERLEKFVEGVFEIGNKEKQTKISVVSCKNPENFQTFDDFESIKKAIQTIKGDTAEAPNRTNDQENFAECLKYMSENTVSDDRPEAENVVAYFGDMLHDGDHTINKSIKQLKIKHNLFVYLFNRNEDEDYMSKRTYEDRGWLINVLVGNEKNLIEMKEREKYDDVIKSIVKSLCTQNQVSSNGGKQNDTQKPSAMCSKYEISQSSTAFGESYSTVEIQSTGSSEAEPIVIVNGQSINTAYDQPASIDPVQSTATTDVQPTSSTDVQSSTADGQSTSIAESDSTGSSESQSTGSSQSESTGSFDSDSDLDLKANVSNEIGTSETETKITSTAGEMASDPAVPRALKDNDAKDEQPNSTVVVVMFIIILLLVIIIIMIVVIAVLHQRSAKKATLKKDAQAKELPKQVAKAQATSVYVKGKSPSGMGMSKGESPERAQTVHANISYSELNA